VRRVALLGALILFGVLASRAPFAAQTLWAHDSALYSAAIERGFHVDDDLRDQRPHPPGYILYVATADVAHAAGLDSNSALVLVSALASALGALALFLFTRRWVTDGIALIAALAYAADPLVWQYSEIAYPYTVLGLGSIAVAWCCLAARGRGLSRALLASMAFGIAGGFRQDLLLLLFPLWLWSVAPLGARRAALAGVTVSLSCLVWIVPTVILSGGPEDYFSALRGQATYVRDAYSVISQGLPALIANFTATTYALGWGLLAIAPLVYAAAMAAALRAWRVRATDDTTFLLIWSLPALGVYVVLHIGDWGYVLSVLPALYVLGARALASVIASAGTRRTPALLASALGVIVGPAALFVLSASPFSAAAIAEHDREIDTRVAYVRENFEPRTTMILTREDFLLVRYYLPEYRARQHDPEPFARSSRRMRASRVERIVVFTRGLVPDQPVDVRRVQCSKGIELVYLDVVPGAVLEFKGERYAVSAN
jgi:Protein of unknown function (DUF2723)